MITILMDCKPFYPHAQLMRHDPAGDPQVCRAGLNGINKKR
jgi:hypothetical protein